MTLKRMIALTLSLIMALTCCFGIVSATNIPDERASLTLSNYEAVLKAGTNGGEIRINYDVTASKPADSIGVSSIAIYKSNGSYVTTITGTTANGLICESDFENTGVYTYKGTSGVSYYAKVTVFATVGSTTDSRTITTGTVKAP